MLSSLLYCHTKMKYLADYFSTVTRTSFDSSQSNVICLSLYKTLGFHIISLFLVKTLMSVEDLFFTTNSCSQNLA